MKKRFVGRSESIKRQETGSARLIPATGSTKKKGYKRNLYQIFPKISRGIKANSEIQEQVGKELEMKVIHVPEELSLKI